MVLCVFTTALALHGCGGNEAPPGAPSISAPGAGNIVDTSDSVTFEYSGEGDAYRISLYSGLSCSNLVGHAESAADSYTWSGLSEGQRYSWVIRALKDGRTYGAESSCRSFATKNVSFDLPEISGYTATPVSQAAGSDITMNFTIDNTSGRARTLYLGATIVLDGTFDSENPDWIDDSAHDNATCVVSAGESGKSCSRLFSIPADTAAGTYEVLWGLWWGYPGEGIKYDLERRAGYLTVTN